MMGGVVNDEKIKVSGASIEFNNMNVHEFANSSLRFFHVY